MPTWSNQIPKDPRGPALPIVRTPAAKPLTAIITSLDLLGTYTHYYKGRTKPCERPDCEPCANGIPFRWHAYVAAIQPANDLHFLFELTASAAEPLIDYRDQHGTLRGCLFEASRWNRRPNGRILIRTKPADLTERRIPDAPDIQKCLAILWDLPNQDLAPGRFNGSKRTLQIHPATEKDQRA